MPLEKFCAITYIICYIDNQASDIGHYVHSKTSVSAIMSKTTFVQISN